MPLTFTAAEEAAAQAAIAQDKLDSSKLYKAALEEDMHTTKQLLASGYCIDAISPDFHRTVAAHLAFEGKIAAVEFLMAFGADVQAVAVAASEGGQCDYAEMLRVKYTISPLNIQIMAAKSGNYDYAKKLTNVYGTMSRYLAIAQGAAERNDWDFVDSWVTSCGCTVAYWAEPLACSAAQGGHVARADALRKLHGVRTAYLAYSAMAGGQRQYAESLCKEDGTPLLRVAMGAACKAYLDDFHSLILTILNEGNFHPASVSIIAGTGNRHYAEFLRVYLLKHLSNAEVWNAYFASAALLEGQLSYVRLLWQAGIYTANMATGDECGKQSEWLFFNAYRAFRAFCFSGDKEFNSFLVQRIKKISASISDEKWFDHLDEALELANQLMDFMQAYHLTYNQALAVIEHPVVVEWLLLSYDPTMQHCQFPADVVHLVASFVANISCDEVARLGVSDNKPKKEVQAFLNQGLFAKRQMKSTEMPPKASAASPAIIAYSYKRLHNIPSFLVSHFSSSASSTAGPSVAGEDRGPKIV